jgi:hypothetical protein
LAEAGEVEAQQDQAREVLEVGEAALLRSSLEEHSPFLLQILLLAQGFMLAGQAPELHPKVTVVGVAAGPAEESFWKVLP